MPRMEPSINLHIWLSKNASFLSLLGKIDFQAKESGSNTMNLGMSVGS